MVANLVKTADPRMDKAIEHFEADMASLRTGRAQTAQVENLMVEQYGQLAPLKTVASISTPDAQTIAISPWDKNLVAVIEKMIRENQALGFNPMSDGNVVRINVPTMTEERRREIVKELGQKAEAANIALRNIRHDVLGEVKRLEKDGQATQDDMKFAEQELNKKIDGYKKKIDELTRAKEAELMTV
jgi:ribosome recycling factor